MAEDERDRREREEGRPGGGRGRVDETGRSGVYPASGDDRPEEDAEFRGQAEWGQGERGAAGYEDHGESEAVHIPPAEEPAQEAETGRSSEEMREAARRLGKERMSDQAPTPRPEQRESTE